MGARPPLLAVLLAAAAAACAGGPATARTLTVLIAQDILSSDPNREVETITDSVLFNVYEPLVGFDAHLGVRPMLAESWEHPEPERWRFRLRRGVRFHDGTPLTAELARDALLALQGSRGHESSEFLSGIREITVPAPLTLDLVTREPRAILANLPPVYLTKPNAGNGFPPLAGTGPFRLREWSAGKRVVLERFPEYWGARPEFDPVVFEPLADARARVKRLDEGSADIVYEVLPELGVVPGRGYRFLRHEGVTVYYLGLNLRRRPGNPFQDLRVRRALHLALDRGRLVERILMGNGRVATQPIPPQAFGYNPDLGASPRDPARARALLAEAGWPKGFKSRLDFFSERLALARSIGEDLLELGVELELNALDKDGVYDLAKAGKSDLFLIGWSFSSGEASEFFEFCLHTPDRQYGFNNYGGYSSPRIDEIAERNAAILDPRARRDLLQRAVAIAMEDLPVLPLVVADDVYGIRAGLRFDPRADGEIWLPAVGSTPR